MSKYYMDDYTPPAVAYQGVQVIQRLFFPKSDPPRTMLDPSAGSGVFGQAVRAALPQAESLAIEPKKHEAWWMSRNYDSYVVGHLEEQLEQADLHGADYCDPVDLVITNPPFHSWRDFVRLCLSLCSHRGIVAFLGLHSWASRGQEGYDFFTKVHTPTMQLNVPGAVSYRGKTTDSRDYCWWVFSRSNVRPIFWASVNLPRLPGRLRKWVDGDQRPGRHDHGNEFQEVESGYLLPPCRQRDLSRCVLPK